MAVEIPLAIKYRPKKLSEVIGQPSIVKAFTNASKAEQMKEAIQSVRTRTPGRYKLKYNKETKTIEPVPTGQKLQVPDSYTPCPDCGGTGAKPTMPDGEPEQCQRCNCTGKLPSIHDVISRKCVVCADYISTYLDLDDHDYETLIDTLQELFDEGYISFPE